MVEKGILRGYPDGTFRPKSNITRAEVVTIINNVLKNLDDILSLRSDKSELKALIGKAKDLNKDDYTISTWNKLKKVLESAIEVFEDENTTQEEVDGVLKKLEDVIGNIKKPSKSASSNGKEDNYPSNIIKVNSIIVTSGGNVATVVNGGTLQMDAVIEPYNATNKIVTWSVTNSTGSATIDTKGLLTALGVGKVTVKAEAKDGSGKYGEKEIVIEEDSSDDKEYELAEGKEYLEYFKDILTTDLSDITYKDYQPAEEALYWLSDLSPKAYTYISGDAVSKSLEDKMDSAFEDILDKFTNTEDEKILSYMIKDRFEWYEGEIKLSDLSGIFIHVRNHR